MPDNPPILLHCCCGPCASACIERLLAEGRTCQLVFSNSNLDTEAEFDLRLENLRKVAGHFGLGEVLVDPYDHRKWLDWVSQTPDFAQCPEGGERCAKCFEWSLGRAASFAADYGMTFTTSLSVSPHKNSQKLMEIGGKSPFFEPYNFKKKNGFLRSIQLSQQLGLYRQKYCGCEFSHAANKPEDAPSGN